MWNVALVSIGIGLQIDKNMYTFLSHSFFYIYGEEDSEGYSILLEDNC